MRRRKAGDAASRSRPCPLALFVLLNLSGLAACLPADTRPEPGSLLVNVVPGGGLMSGAGGTLTEDGWAISYERFLIGLGRVALDGDRCVEYSDARYSRVFDMVAAEPQKVSLQYALGPCDFGFGVVTPSSESLLGASVTPADVVFMRTPGEDAYTGPGGVSIYVRGRATRADVVKTFAWSFRWRLEYERCTAPEQGQAQAGVSLSGGRAEVVEIQIAGDALFEDNPDPLLARLRFDPFADADTRLGNADGAVTLDELDQVPVADLPASAGYAALASAPAGGLEASAGSAASLADYLYLSAFPRVARYRGVGACDVHVDDERGRD